MKPVSEDDGNDVAKIDWQADQVRMIHALRGYGIRDERVLKAMESIPRDRFIPSASLGSRDPYGDHPCIIGFGQTISQPYIVAYMTELLGIVPADRVLEIGTGCGYQTAVLAALEAYVFTIEIIPQLAEHAQKLLAELGVQHVQFKVDDGYAGWPECGPYQAIIAACAPTTVPDKLVAQLAENGRMVLPVGVHRQSLQLWVKKDGVMRQERSLPVRFVPMVHGRRPTTNIHGD